jgi:hypothetical protein
MHPVWRVTRAALALCLGAENGLAQTLSLDDVARQIPTSSLVNNAATLTLFDLRCAHDTDLDAAALKTAINRYAAVGAHQIGRDAFRTLFLDALAERQQQSGNFGLDRWCARVGEDLKASGLETVIRSPAK